MAFSDGDHGYGLALLDDVSVVHQHAPYHTLVGKRDVCGSFCGEYNAAVVGFVAHVAQEAPYDKGSEENDDGTGKEIGGDGRHVEMVGDFAGRLDVFEAMAGFV